MSWPRTSQHGLSFPEKTDNKTILELNKSLNKVNLQIQNIQIQNRQQEQYFQALLEHAATGILTFDDKLGERVLTACRWSDLPVPDLVAVLGIGNDDLVSKLTWPSLSSINVPAERIGFEAADILDHAIRRRRIKRPRRQLPATGVTMRGSTDVLAVQDELVESAAQHVREHAGEAIGVEHIARAVGVSRRTLDRRFAQALGRSVHEELSAVRMQKACVLLSESQETVASIAAACGFRTAASFSRAFHRQNGCWPIEYRNRVRG